MRRTAMIITAALTLAVFAVNAQTTTPKATKTDVTSAQEARADIQKTFGFVPTFFKKMSEESLPGAWQDTKALEFSENTAIPQKYKKLIGLAVSSQNPCEHCTYFTTESAKGEGANDKEISEAVAMASITRRWSTVLNGNQIDKSKFRAEFQQMMNFTSRPQASASDVSGTESSSAATSTSEMDSDMAAATDTDADSEAVVDSDTVSDTESVSGTTSASESETTSGATTPAESTSSSTAANAAVKATYDDITKTFGMVPEFMRLYPQSAISGAWQEFKAVQLNPNTAVPQKYKELIGLAVASQIPCDYCTMFHTEAAKRAGASDEEIREAVALSGLTVHWSTVLNGLRIDPKTFEREMKRGFQYMKKQGSQPRRQAAR